MPRSVAFAGAWGRVAGFIVLLMASQSHTLSPWTMACIRGMTANRLMRRSFICFGENVPKSA